MKNHLRQESLAHEIHASHVHIHGEVPVCFFTVQDGAVVHEPVSKKPQWTRAAVENVLLVS